LKRPKLGSVRAALKAKSAARSDGGQGLTEEITVKRRRVNKESEEAMCLLLITTDVHCNGRKMSLHVPYI
jgi:hypothetical protein